MLMHPKKSMKAKGKKLYLKKKQHPKKKCGNYYKFFLIVMDFFQIMLLNFETLLLNYTYEIHYIMNNQI